MEGVWHLMPDRAPPDTIDDTDTGHFDGSAEPNPGGRMGIGWVLDLADGASHDGRLTHEPHPDNSNNQAEYMALCALLEAYVALGRPGPLVVRGDNELVIRQMRDDYGVRSSGLIPLHAQATAIAARVTLGVRFEWVPRSANARADALAAGKPLEQLAAERDPERQVRPTTPPDPSTLSQALAAQVARLNAQGTMGFRDCDS